MPLQHVKYYQTGSHVVGNRLLPPEERTVQARMDRSNSLTSGHRACQGCGEALGARAEDAFVVNGAALEDPCSRDVIAADLRNTAAA